LSTEQLEKQRAKEARKARHNVAGMKYQVTDQGIDQVAGQVTFFGYILGLAFSFWIHHTRLTVIVQHTY